MPIETYYDGEHHLWTHRVRGAFGPQEVAAAQRRIYAAPDHDPDVAVLWDLTAADAGPLSAADMRWMVDLSRPFWQRMGRGKSAIVSPRDREYGMARMYQTLAQEAPRRLRVFRSAAEALAWLGEEA
jgi:hypothetical protein